MYSLPSCGFARCEKDRAISCPGVRVPRCPGFTAQALGTGQKVCVCLRGSARPQQRAPSKMLNFDLSASERASRRRGERSRDQHDGLQEYGLWGILLRVFIPGWSIFASWWESSPSFNELKMVVVGGEEEDSTAGAREEVELEARDGAATVLEDATQAVSLGDGAASQQPAEITPALVEDAPAVEEGAEQA